MCILFYRSEGSKSFYHYFTPPLPESLVLFAIAKDGIQDHLVVKVSIDTSLEDKVLGELNNEKTCINWNGVWTLEEKEAANQVLQSVS